jgi:hypothetical protein
MPRPRRVEEPVKKQTVRSGTTAAASPARSAISARPMPPCAARCPSIAQASTTRSPPDSQKTAASATGDQHGQKDQGAHANTSLSAKSAPTAGKLSSAATAPPMAASSASSPA